MKKRLVNNEKVSLKVPKKPTQKGVWQLHKGPQNVCLGYQSTTRELNTNKNGEKKLHIFILWETAALLG